MAAPYQLNRVDARALAAQVSHTRWLVRALADSGSSSPAHPRWRAPWLCARLRSRPSETKKLLGPVVAGTARFAAESLIAGRTILMPAGGKLSRLRRPDPSLR